MRVPSNKIADVARFFRDELKYCYPKEEVETFIAYCFEEFLGLRHADIFLNSNDTITESELLKFNFAIKDLKQNKPIQYILGKADFYGLKFLVNKHVLIPRHETEELVDLIIKETGTYTPTSILDIGTGSGCIPIALKKNIPKATIYALDISLAALEVAKQNATMNNVHIDFFQYDILASESPLPNQDSKFNIIVSNPPYICISEKEQMQKNVLDYEPHIALFVSDNDPLVFYKMIADFALRHLEENGKLYLEINRAFGLETKQMLEIKGFKNVLMIKDLNNNNRILQGSI